MTEVEKLELRHEKMGVTKSHASWTSEGEKLSDEEKAKIINDMYDGVQEQMNETVEVPVIQMKDIYESLLKLSALGKTTVEKWSNMSTKEVTLMLKVRDAVGMSLCLAGNWLSKEDKREIKNKLED